MIQSGAYTPVCYALFWPRRDLLRWAGRIETDVPELPLNRMSKAA
jgi:hypothetical protein